MIDDLILYRKDTTGILRGLNNLLSLKRVVEPELYMGGYVGTYETNGESTHAFVAWNYTKKASENINKLFETKVNKYESLLEGVYHTDAENYDMLVGDTISR